MVKVPIDFENDDYGYIFQLIRIAKNLKLKDISKQYDICESSVTLLEKTKNPTNKYLEKFCFIYDISNSQLKRIHDISKNKYNWDYQKTLKEILDYYIAKKYFKETY